MGNLTYIVVLILIAAWAIGFFGFDAGGLIHMLLFSAIVLIILKLTQEKKVS